MQRRKFVELGAACALPARAEEERPILVAASFDAMAELVKVVGGSLVRVETLIPPGAEPHDFTPTVKTTQLLRAASVLVVNGFGMEPWAKKIAAAAENPRLMLVTASEGAVPVKNSDPDEIAEHGADDPHLWLSLSGAEIEARNIAERSRRRTRRMPKRTECSSRFLRESFTFLKLSIRRASGMSNGASSSPATPLLLISAGTSILSRRAWKAFSQRENPRRSGSQSLQSS